MATDMDEQLFRQQHGWSLQLQTGQEIRLTPGPKEASEPLCVTDVFLVDPGSTAGQGVVAAFVEIGTRNIILAVLSSETPHVKLQTPVELDEEFCFYLMRPGGDSDGDGEVDADADGDAVVVQFQGYALPSADTKEEIEEDCEEDDRIDEEIQEEEEEEEIQEEEEESDGSKDTEDGDDAAGSDFSWGYGSRDDGADWGLQLGTVIDGPSGRVRGRKKRRRRSRSRSRRSFVSEVEGLYLGGPAPPPQFGVGAERARRIAPEAVVLGIFVVAYLIAMIVMYIG